MCSYCVQKVKIAPHSVPRVILTLRISNIMETSIFSSGWVVGTTTYAQFCPIPSPFLLIFSKNDFEVLKVLENQQNPPKNVDMGEQNWTKLSIGRDSYNQSRPKNRCLYNSRNLGGQNHSGHPVRTVSSFSNFALKSYSL